MAYAVFGVDAFFGIHLFEIPLNLYTNVLRVLTKELDCFFIDFILDHALELLALLLLISLEVYPDVTKEFVDFTFVELFHIIQSTISI